MMCTIVYCIVWFNCHYNFRTVYVATPPLPSTQTHHCYHHNEEEDDQSDSATNTYSNNDYGTRR